MRKSKYTIELLEPLVAQATSMASLLKLLGLEPTGGNYRNINQRLKVLSLDNKHWTGQGWSKGHTVNTNPNVARITQRNTLPMETIFKNPSEYRTSGLWKKLIQIGWEYKCSNCQLTEWLGKPIRLHVDHINGNNTDARLENLRFLCPNCHQQTPTWGSKPR